MVDRELFYERMLEYNHDVFPLIVLGNFIVLALIIAVAIRWKHANRAMGGFLSGLFLFIGSIQLILYYGSVSSQYYVWGGLWIAQGFLFLFFLVYKNSLALEFRRDAASGFSVFLILFALALYPAIGFLSGHGFPAGPIFPAAPCPAVIFVFAVLCVNRNRLPLWLVAIPLLWSLTGIYAVLFLQVPQDAVETLAGVLGTIVIAARNASLGRLKQHPA